MLRQLLAATTISLTAAMPVHAQYAYDATSDVSAYKGDRKADLIFTNPGNTADKVTMSADGEWFFLVDWKTKRVEGFEGSKFVSACEGETIETDGNDTTIVGFNQFGACSFHVIKHTDTRRSVIFSEFTNTRNIVQLLTVVRGNLGTITLD